MAVCEFSLIDKYFSWPLQNPVNQLAVGDDCALLKLPAGQQLAVTTDTMVSGVHFFPDVEPEALGHKLLAVNLSDLASMGAEPFAVTLALTLPKVDEQWLARFASGFRQLAQQFNVDLIGGDTTSGPLTLTVQAMGMLPTGSALLRSTAEPGDLIYVTGCLGDAGLGLKIKQGFTCSSPDLPMECFNKPWPRVQDGLFLRDKAHACIDISDGLASDLGHILKQSQVGACINWQQLPLSQQVKDYIDQTGDWSLPLTAGDDYQLCFTVSPEYKTLLNNDYHCIGVIDEQPGLRIARNGTIEQFKGKGFEHFS